MGSIVLSRSPALVRYVVTQNVTVTATVYNDAGALADASGGVTIVTTHPEGVDTDETVTHASTGVYTTVVTLDASDRWSFTAQAAGDIVAADKLSITVQDTDTSGVTADSTVLAGDLDAEEGTHPYKGVTAWQQRRGWIIPDADNTGVADATAEFNRCSLVAYGSGSRTGCVYYPEGRYRVDGALTAQYGVTHTGPERGLSSGHRIFNDGAGLQQTGALFLARGVGKLFTLKHQARVMNLEIYYPDQVVNATPAAYGYTFYIGANEPGCYVGNITCTNPYKFLYANSVATIDNIYGFPLSEGIHLARVADPMRTANVNFNYSVSYDIGATLLAWVAANGRAFPVEQAEEFNFTDCFAIGYLIGLDFKVEATPDGSGSYGSWKGGGFDATKYCIVVNATTSLSGAGLKVVGASFVPTGGGGGNAVICQDTVNSSSPPVIHLLGCSVHGVHDRTVWVKSTSTAFVQATGGTWEGATNQATLNDSTVGGMVDLDRVRMPAAASRTGGAGFTRDRDGTMQSPSNGTPMNGAIYKSQSVAVGATNIFGGNGIPPAGNYDVAIDVIVSTAETGGSHTVAASVSYGDDLGVTTSTTSTLALSATGRLHTTLPIQCDGTHAPQYSTAFAGAAGTGTPVYTLRVHAKAR